MANETNDPAGELLTPEGRLKMADSLGNAARTARAAAKSLAATADSVQAAADVIRDSLVQRVTTNRVAAGLEQITDRQRCPHDGGACHHGCCADDRCWRLDNCGPLTTPWPGFPIEGRTRPVPPGWSPIQAEGRSANT